MGGVTALRSWASRDPNSILYGKEVPSPEKVLASDLLNTPLHKRESNILGDGGSAMVVVSAEDAKAMLMKKASFDLPIPEVPGLTGPHPTRFHAEYDAAQQAYRFTFSGFLPAA